MTTSRLIFTSLLLGSLGLSTAFVAAAETPPNTLTDAEKRSGWRLLFDGATADAWRNYRKETLSDGWVVDGGVLTRAKSGAGDIVTKQQYQYFELSLEYRISKGGNSGLMFHVAEQNSPPWHTGPEVQIQDNVDGHDPQKSGWLYQLYRPVKPAWAKQFEEQVGIKTPDVDDATRPAGEWNEIYLRIAANQCEVAVNGVSYYRFKLNDDDWAARVAKSKFANLPLFGKAGKGHICLQDHGNVVSFRSIKLRELPEDGSVPNPVDGRLALKSELAFPNLKWAGRDEEEESGRVRPLRPMVLTQADDGTNRVFVATQRGAIHVFENSSAATETKMFLNLTEKVHDWKKDNEEGLLGLAFHPKNKENGFFYVYYSSEQEPHVSIVSRFKASADDPNVADPQSETIVMKIPQPFANHNGGSIAFGPDGYLYIGLGDGGGRNDPLRSGQDLGSWMGSILRIDVDGKSDGANYAVPSDNPFVKRDGAKPEIFAYGFRNLWRIAFDRQTGHLWASDVGQDRWEEVNVVRAGGNYGWSGREAGFGFGNVPVKSDDPVVDPAWMYDHQVGKSITGGYVYRGKA
ncbi:MAG: PQQ-dependent sugar dehydrogenase, partial [Planctomycetales bacterium]|nr:PQQ-dependent sugar dehydrogenase [Planctomycetales bacterium]